MSNLFQPLYRVGHELWATTRGDEERAVRIVNAIQSLSVDQRIQRLCLHQWVDGACRMVRTTEDYFTAMACTSIGEEDVSLKIPWPTFAVAWPGDSVTIDGIPVNVAIVTSLPCNLGSAILMAGRLGDQLILSCARWKSNVADMLFLNDRGDAGPQAHVVKRAIVGILYTMDHTNNWSVSGLPSPISRGSLRESPPPHRVIIVGRPLNYSMAPAVRAECKGGRSAPSVQTLVRGHRKRQVCGTGRIGRKVIWVEPYWRGPENAPILARPYSVQ